MIVPHTFVSGYERAMVRGAETQHVHASQREHTRHVMSSPTPFTDRSDQHDSPQPATDAMQQIAAPFAEAANDGEFYRNPLWLVAGAMGLLFALLACLTAAG
jgi:hypothetical protein